MRRTIRLTIAWLLALSLLLPLWAYAESGEGEDYGILDSEALTALVEDYCAGRGLKKENMSVGYCYTPTGDTWYYNGDTWYYSASMYKVPLMMNLAERYVSGEITDETRISGLTLAEANRHVLVNSNNDYAHAMMHYFGTDAECRELYKRYSDLPEEYYVDDFLDYSYFTAHFMTDVMKTLYYESERFPNVIESLKLAQPGHYFHSTLPQYEIAQKYGSLQDVQGVIFNHTTAIVYTPNPFILTVMTKNMGQGEDILAGVAKRFEEVTLALDEELPAYEARLQEAERLAQEEAERLAREQEELNAQTSEESAPVPEESAAPVFAPAEAETEESVPSIQTPPRKSQNRSDQILAAFVMGLAFFGIALIFLFTAPQRIRERKAARRRRRMLRQRRKAERL